MTDRQTPLSDDELLSAYLDGELTGDDLARAERLLAEQPGSRQLLAELRALGDELRALPSGKLGESFPERVLRKAERQLLTESQVSTASPAARSPARWRNKRPWIYAVASLAAGLLVAIVSWPQRSMKEPAGAADSRYPAAVASSHSAPAAKSAIAPTPPENQTGLRAALAQWGVTPHDADEIVEQVSEKQQNEQSPAEAQPLIVWSLAVSPDALEHEGLERVLARHEVQVVEQLPLSLGRAASADAAGDRPPAVKLSVAGSSASQSPVMAVLVSGSQQQLDATLVDLRSRSDTFQQVTDLGRQSLTVDRLSRKRKASLAPQAGRGDASGGHAQTRAQAAAEKPELPPSRSMRELQAPAELVLFILRRAEPSSPASTSESGKAEKPAAGND